MKLSTSKVGSVMVISPREAIVQLPRHLRELVLLRDLAQMPYHRVASILGITVGTARVYRRQAVLRLAELLEGAEAES